MNLGVVGCGNVSDIYFKNCARFEKLKVVACADLDPERARTKAAQFGIPRACTTAELLADPSVELVVNITPPQGHFEVSRQALEAGKHVYSEKILVATRDEGRRLLELARRRDRRIGCAPDTFLGASHQTCRKLIDAGTIGKPVAAAAFMMYPGHESWHPDPEFFYQPGGGPLFDMGPYYLTALIHLFGPVSRVSSTTRTTYAERSIKSGPRKGVRFAVNVPTHVAALVEFKNGVVLTMIMSFDGSHHHLPCLEVYGTLGSMSVPDPNGFGGEVSMRLAEQATWEVVPPTHGYAENSRGIGLADMVESISSGVPHRVSAEMAFHVVDVMQSIHEAAREQKAVALASTCERPAPMPEGLEFGRLKNG